MVATSLPVSFFLILLAATTTTVLCNSNVSCKQPPRPPEVEPVYPMDVEYLQLALNLEYLEAEWFLFASLGQGLDALAPELVNGGPSPIGVQKANLDDVTRRIIEEFGYQEIGHLREIIRVFGGFPRPLMDLSSSNFAKLFDEAVGQALQPPFDPYQNSLNYILACYVVPYVGLVGYVGTNQNIYGHRTKRILAGLLGVEAGQDAVLRTLLYERGGQLVQPYNYTVAEFTVFISDLRNRLAKCGNKDEGLVVPLELGAEKRTSSNILAANDKSLTHSRTPAQTLRTVYATGNENKPGGFFPNGANGKIATDFLYMS
ncbi:ferritin-like catalase Nec2 [Aristolochia californica]|uniref:ferritin-like catalase Nec2 n=1 Tax=Aristolochia californica TaxID=171875 RepID=UPI0035E002AC